MRATITDPITGITLPGCQHVDDDIFCGKPGSNTCQTCKKRVCGLHTRWHHVEGLAYDVALCVNCEAYRLRSDAWEQTVQNAADFNAASMKSLDRFLEKEDKPDDPGYFIL